jgi:magnesium transporter
MPRVIIGTTPLGSLISESRGSALVLLELVGFAFFAAGVADRIAGPLAPWCLLAAVLLGIGLRAVDLEATALFIPGGTYGTARHAFGGGSSRLAGAALLSELLLFAAMMASAAGHAIAALLVAVPGLSAASRQITLDDTSMFVAVCLIGAAWLGLRQGRAPSKVWVTRTVAASLGLLLLAVVLGILATTSGRPLPSELTAPFAGARPSILGVLSAIGACLFAAGSAEALGRASPDFPQPRIQNLRRASRLINASAIVLTAGSGLLFVWLVPEENRAIWQEASSAGLTLFGPGPPWLAVILAAVTSLAALGFLGLAVHRAAANAHELMLRFSEDGLIARPMREVHPRYGTAYRLVDLATIAQLAIVIASAGQLTWVARAYAVSAMGASIVKIVGLIRLRRSRPEVRAYRVPINPPIGGRERPLGLAALAVVLAAPILALLLGGDVAALAGVGGIAALTAALAASERAARATEAAAAESFAPLDLLATPTVGLDQARVRPGNILVAVRKPGALGHLASALQAAGDRDVVVMTVRLLGLDVSDGSTAVTHRTTVEERRVLGAAALVAERFGRAVSLVIVPAANVFDAVAETVVRLQSSEVFVGESESLAAADQARLLGDAWERIPKPASFEVRLIIHHSSGRTAVYQLGAHAPSLNADDLRLIHSLWLDVTKAIGPHVHHHDVVRAALKHMEEELNTEGPPRDAALDLIRRTARPGDELAAAVRARDFAGLRDTVRNRPPSDIADALTDLTLEDQVVTFRVLPRKLAAATFEYLSLEAQATLLKAMAQEDVAALLNNMAPDDRTMFLEELPASATQQLLTLLTPEERKVAVDLLGYAPDSIGRLMTPDYIAVREHWTLQQVLDYIRTHGHDSETLNVIYVVDERGVLIDDIRIRELLLTAPTNHVADLMDRRFVALNAADPQDMAVTVFRRDDRSALPVTDSTGVLIGIVTIDDVLDVAEAAATKEIQRIGGSEALDEPYTEISFPRMIQKRAGWLTALFLGEMLTATAMGAFEKEIERAVVLALFVPLIISSGGNSGSQASTLVIRAIALGEVKLHDWWFVMRREIAAGLALGAILGTIGFLRISVWSTFSNIYGEHWLLVAVTVGLALIGVVLWGTLVGSLLPFLLRRLGFDPATSSAPFVATLVDVTGLIIYFSVGLVILRGSLL